MAQWFHIRRMLDFLKLAKRPALFAATIFIACTAAEVTAVYLLKPAVNLVEQLSAEYAEQKPESLWNWLTMPGGSGISLFYALLWLGLARLRGEWLPGPG